MLSLLCPEESAHRHVVQEHIRRNETKMDFQHKMKLKFLLNLILSSPGLLIIRVAVYLIYPCMEGSSPFISCWCFRAWFRQNVSDFEYIWEMKTCDQPFWFSCMKADLTFSENSQLTIFSTKYGGDPFNDVFTFTMYFVCSFYVLRDFLFSSFRQNWTSDLLVLIWCQTRSSHLPANIWYF